MFGYGRLSLEYGLRLMTLHEEWAKWAIDHIQAGPPRAAAEQEDERDGRQDGPDERVERDEQA
jgi:hypothetical protein